MANYTGHTRPQTRGRQSASCNELDLDQALVPKVHAGPLEVRVVDLTNVSPRCVAVCEAQRPPQLPMIPSPRLQRSRQLDGLRTHNLGGWRPCVAGLLLGLRLYRGLGAIHISKTSEALVG